MAMRIPLYYLGLDPKVVEPIDEVVESFDCGCATIPLTALSKESQIFSMKLRSGFEDLTKIWTSQEKAWFIETKSATQVLRNFPTQYGSEATSRSTIRA
ncbi:hypothetical protein AVEN_144633-1 [Araneus ventricosus]|uniref:Uncharacterized protein n=1 Tax=Araneus ventricosus TaxID=182803 RepID=A0A4Y2BY77_ARAVE|nr:hypothetical protein AVEN_144633-1 [Araneus ventricosus]